MGWTYSNKPESREQVAERVLGPNFHMGASLAHVRHGGGTIVFDAFAWGKPNLWFRMTHHLENGEKYAEIGLLRLGQHGGTGWGEGGIWGEDCGPCELDCPAALFDAVPTLADEKYLGSERRQWAQGWRFKMLEKLEQERKGKTAHKELRIGSVLEFPESFNVRRLTVCHLEGRKVFGTDDKGKRWKITPKVTARAAIS